MFDKTNVPAPSVRVVTFEPISALIVTTPAPAPEFVIVPILLRVAVPNVSAPAPALLIVKLFVPVTPPENVVV